MPRKSDPKYRCQKGKTQDRAFVELKGKRFYLGQYGSPDSYQKYHSLIARITATAPPHANTVAQFNISSLAVSFLNHAQLYYRSPNGVLTSEYATYRCLLKLLTHISGNVPAEAFGPLLLKAVRHAMIQKGWCRSNVNKQINRIRTVFKWAAGEELIPVTVYQSLQAVAPLKRGRTEAVESEPVHPVPEEHIQVVRPFVSKQIWALINLQLLTGARAGELVLLRSDDIIQSKDVWTYTPELHKTSHHGKSRTIYFGPQAQLLLEPNLECNGYMFSPKHAIAQLAANRKTHRRPLQKPSPRKTARKVQDHYTTASYRRAIHRACKKASIPIWSPHQLRHNAATRFRKQFGIETARLLLGHESLISTQIYAEIDAHKAVQAALQLG